MGWIAVSDSYASRRGAMASRKMDGHGDRVARMALHDVAASSLGRETVPAADQTFRPAGSTTPRDRGAAAVAAGALGGQSAAIARRPRSENEPGYEERRRPAPPRSQSSARSPWHSRRSHRNRDIRRSRSAPAW